MGVYLSSPKTDKFSQDGENDRLRYGLSSMQGWRATMEDAVSTLYDLCVAFVKIQFRLYVDAKSDSLWYCLCCLVTWTLTQRQGIGFDVSMPCGLPKNSHSFKCELNCKIL